ncbi:MAG: hypothetical protein AAB372_01320 [Patescibacteria group bacterium]
MFGMTALLLALGVPLSPLEDDSCKTEEITSVPRSVYRDHLLAISTVHPDLHTGDLVCKVQSHSDQDSNQPLIYVHSGQVKPAKPPTKPKPSPVDTDDEPVHTALVTVTAYSSRVGETDSTPFVTASGKRVRWGIVASNAFEFGTKVKFPDLFGQQVFVVQDRMNKRHGSNRMDIWFSSTRGAQEFGARTTRAEIIGHPDV